MLYEYNDFRLSSKLMDLVHKLVVRYVIAYMACFKHGIELSPHFSNLCFQNEGPLGKQARNSPPAVDYKSLLNK